MARLGLHSSVCLQLYLSGEGRSIRSNGTFPPLAVRLHTCLPLSASAQFC